MPWKRSTLSDLTVSVVNVTMIVMTDVVRSSIPSTLLLSPTLKLPRVLGKIYENSNVNRKIISFNSLEGNWTTLIIPLSHLELATKAIHITRKWRSLCKQVRTGSPLSLSSSIMYMLVEINVNVIEDFENGSQCGEFAFFFLHFDVLPKTWWKKFFCLSRVPCVNDIWYSEAFKISDTF